VLYDQFKEYLEENACKLKQEHKHRHQQQKQQKLSALEQLKQIPKTPQNAKVLKILKNMYKQKEGNTKKKSAHTNTTEDTSPVPWVETLLNTPLRDHRKYCIWRILVPYLANKRQLSYEETFDLIDTWLDKCHKLVKLDFNKEERINEAWDSVTANRYYQISFDSPDKEPRTLKTQNNTLYKILKAKGCTS
jgi:hypothetical protein